MIAIRKHWKDFAAICALFLVALVVAAIILGHQRVHLPWSDFYEVNAEMSTVQAVTPGQGQTVDIAGVEVGEISSVKLEDGKAVIGMRIDKKYAPIYRDATVLLRPKTGLKDMVAELTPGTPSAGKLDDGGTIPVSQTLPDVNLDEILSSLDADTRDYLRLLLNDGGQALKGNGRALGQTLRRIEPTARYARQINEALATRRENIKRVVHNFSLLTDELGKRDDQVAGFVQNTNAVFATLSQQDAALPTVQELRPALRDLAAATPNTSRSFDVLNALLNTVAYNPPGKTDEGYLFWQSWLNHLAPTVFSQQDAHGPIRHGLIVLSCQTAQTLRVVAAANPLLGTLVQLLNAPTQEQICPKTSQPGTP